ncbi:peptidyl-tRNA hydrolase [Wallemia mellicola CBS 633.66]|uniref:peptidyl-tRNA hydrolase n=2 Tax=Wallemia mellicola TaxID=1708541 RepID=A0A4T0M5M5_9BASI|nr:peptidyl-tRNA hydrolase [Wallemia mellicola CBS 633.66]TIB78034.1 hypothetical protein E3Q23_00974 [Wallemia mellicola]EIM21005.1 peptidyl-tRNA hydrolase [Wallemia mellicola CBS 633.66]TIB93349.1 peptidyl-tRNA hydrolase [Wallemia mellicola]TIC07543.1 peptidyl-tRNA hydrolase [Wallemia mellicola]TIC16615.1 peptidyl-tRNA hydrolase [Wallemia mellicola]|eukprot:XP_006958905.1 peptidyl-tRNA hydrolase [Wallemia mellicola CBS 633.66]
MQNKILIAGLGNLPYPTTYHSIGQLFLIEYARKHNLLWQKKGAISSAQIDDRVHICYSHHLMNVSGKSISSYYSQIRAEKLLVLHDDLQRDWMKISFKAAGSANGHNGLKSIAKHMGTDFDRLRIGIGRPEDKSKVPDYVLSKMNTSQLDELRNGSLYDKISQQLDEYIRIN